MQARGASRPNRAEVRQLTVCFREELGREIAAAYINRCDLLSLGEVGLNFHHPTAVPPFSPDWWLQLGLKAPL